MATVAAAVGLSAINVGLGAYMPNFRETDPSKIVAGLLYLVVVSVMAAPVHVAGLQQWLGGTRDADLPAWVFAGVPVGLAIGAAAVVLPLRAGARALRATEF